MAGITLEIAEARLTEYLAAEAKVLGGQDYVTADGERLTRADLAAIQAGIKLWNARCQQLSRTSLRVREVIPR